MITDRDSTSASRVETTQRDAGDRAGARVVILAGGDGARSLAVTRALTGDDRPKQFAPLVGTEPLLRQTNRRAILVAPPDRTLIVVTRRHEAWYRELMPADEPFRLLVQPENRGTATAVLFALLRISAESTQAPVVILPSDHWVSSDSAFMLQARTAVEFAEKSPSAVVLLGAPPTRPETEYGWIEAGAPFGNGWGGLATVREFVEKPSPQLASDLFAKTTSLWNTSVVVGRVEELLLRFALARPELVDRFLEIWTALGTGFEEAALERLYASLPAADLSRDIVSTRSGPLWTIPIRGVAWEHLGHPRGILEARRLRDAPAWIETRGVAPPFPAAGTSSPRSSTRVR